MVCPICGTDNDDSNKYCINCGHELVQKTGKSNTICFWLAGIIISLLLLFGIYKLIIEPRINQ
jgi:hypothetical protein